MPTQPILFLNNFSAPLLPDTFGFWLSVILLELLVFLLLAIWLKRLCVLDKTLPNVVGTQRKSLLQGTKDLAKVRQKTTRVAQRALELPETFSKGWVLKTLLRGILGRVS